MSAPSLSDVVDCINLIERELVEEKWQKAELEGRLAQMAVAIEALSLGGLEECLDAIPRPGRRSVEPAQPSEFDGDRSKGRAFLNSCLLYLSFCSKDFPDDQARILWMLSFLKSGRAAVFAT